MAKKSTSKAASSSKAKPEANSPATGPFNQPVPPNASRTVAGVLGEITWLMTQSPAHKGFFISDLEWLVMPSVMLQQFRMFYDQGKPIGVALFARVNEEVEERLAAGNARLRPQDWKSGEKLWIVEIIAPFGGHKAMLKDFKEQVFNDTEVHYLLRTAKGNKVRTL